MPKPITGSDVPRREPLQPPAPQLSNKEQRRATIVRTLRRRRAATARRQKIQIENTAASVTHYEKVGLASRCHREGNLPSRSSVSDNNVPSCCYQIDVSLLRTCQLLACTSRRRRIKPICRSDFVSTCHRPPKRDPNLAYKMSLRVCQRSCRRRAPPEGRKPRGVDTSTRNTPMKIC